MVVDIRLWVRGRNDRGEEGAHNNGGDDLTTVHWERQKREAEVRARKSWMVNYVSMDSLLRSHHNAAIGLAAMYTPLPHLDRTWPHRMQSDGASSFLRASETEARRLDLLRRWSETWAAKRAAGAVWTCMQVRPSLHVTGQRAERGEGGGGGPVVASPPQAPRARTG